MQTAGQAAEALNEAQRSALGWACLATITSGMAQHSERGEQHASHGGQQRGGSEASQRKTRPRQRARREQPASATYAKRSSEARAAVAAAESPRRTANFSRTFALSSTETSGGMVAVAMIAAVEKKGAGKCGAAVAPACVRRADGQCAAEASC